MTRRSGWWGLAAALYVAVNGFGAIYAAVRGEVPHAMLHVVLLVVGAAVWSRTTAAREARAARLGSTTSTVPGDALGDRFRNLEQSIDAVAIEVERIGEGQRHMTNLLVDRDGPAAAGSSAPQPTDVERDRSSS